MELQFSPIKKLFIAILYLIGLISGILLLKVQGINILIINRILWNINFKVLLFLTASIIALLFLLFQNPIKRNNILDLDFDNNSFLRRFLPARKLFNNLEWVIVLLLLAVFILLFYLDFILPIQCFLFKNIEFYMFKKEYFFSKLYILELPEWYWFLYMIFCVSSLLGLRYNTAKEAEAIN